MKFFNKLVTNISYSGKIVKLMWRNDKAYLFYILIDIAVCSGLPFINIFLIQKSIWMLENQSNFQQYIMEVVGLIMLGFGTNCLHDYLDYKRNIHGGVIELALYKKQFEKTLDMDYEMLLDKEVQEKKELALKMVSNNRFSQIVSNFQNFVSNLIILLGLVAVLSQIDIWILAISLIVVVANVAITIYRNKCNRAIDVDFNPISRRVWYFVETGSSFSRIKEIKTYGMKKRLVAMYSDLQKEMRGGINKVFHLSLVGTIISHVLNFLLDTAAYAYLGFRVLVRRNLSLANFSMFLNAIYNFSGSIEAIVSTFARIYAEGAYLQDYFDFMDLKTMHDKNALAPLHLPEKMSCVFTFDHVSYRYPQQEVYALRDVSLEIRSGEKIAIVGENGAGKTTLMMLLMRLVEPTQGKILLNGTDIRRYDEDEYRKLFSTVFQDFTMFSFTIQDNITALGDVNAPKVKESLERSGLETKIASLNKGVDTYIDKLYDNEGIVLSGGEAQRLAIARALYKNAPIYVLDEPTAALDPRIENEIYTKFRDITEGKTTFYITHRLASTHFCDRIIVLEKGSVKETGNHRELMEQRGYYAELYNMQAQYYLETDEG